MLEVPSRFFISAHPHENVTDKTPTDQTVETIENTTILEKPYISHIVGSTSSTTITLSLVLSLELLLYLILDSMISAKIPRVKHMFFPYSLKKKTFEITKAVVTHF